MREDRVYGPPGTGKTEYLARQIEAAAAKYGGLSIRVTSLTKTAAKEIRTRAAEADLPDDATSTLHSLCFRALGCKREQMAEGGAALKDWNNRHWRWAISGTSTLDDPYAPPRNTRRSTDIFAPRAVSGSEHLEEYGCMRHQMIPRERWRPIIVEFAKAWEAWKRETDRLDFTDLIEQGIEIGPLPGIDVFFCDETQDYSPLELRLVRSLTSRTDRLVLAGDDDQAIYGFRGATPDAFLKPDLPADQIHVLSQSYRLPRAVLELSDRWIRKVKNRQEKAFKPRQENGLVAEGKVLWSALSLSLSHLIAKAIGQTESGRTMILTSCGYMLNSILQALRAEGIPYHNPHRPTEWKWNPLARQTLLLNFLRPERSAWGGEARPWTWAEFGRLIDPLRVKDSGLVYGAKAEIERMAKGEEADRIVDPQLVAAYFGREDGHELLWWWRGSETSVTALTWWAKNLRLNEAKRVEYPMEILSKHGPDALRAHPRVIIGTIHSVKGGEAEHVYLFPDLSVAGAKAWFQDQDSIRRQMYVGMTRARETLTICQPQGPASRRDLFLPKSADVFRELRR